MPRSIPYAAFEYHGGPYDRGAADSYYGRPREPHKYPNGTGNGPKVTDLTQLEQDAYEAGYDDNEADRNFKDWG